MEIQTRITDLNRRLRVWRILLPFGCIGVTLLYLALVIPAARSKPTFAVIATVIVGIVVPSLIRWHSLRIERRVLDELEHEHETHA